ncbi:MAG: multidrug efflux RND transporter permease subunit [Pseudomonadota bacterium]
MTFSSFFIQRPIFASVISILIFLAGLVSMFNLPIAEYPEVSPPTIQVTANFPGANPATISETVATPLEEQINGVENMIYMNSLASTDGRVRIDVTFEIGTDPDLAQQLVQNRVTQATPRLPDVTRQLGVTVAKSSPDLTMVVHMRSPNGKYDGLYLRNYGTLNVKDELAKIQGVGQVLLFGSGDYAMRVWLNPDKIAERGMTASEVVNAIRAQNVQVAAGVIGGPPYAETVQLQLPVNVQGRLESPEEFEQIIIKRDENGVVTYLRDVARLELDAQTYALRSMLNNEQAVAIPIFASPGANALQISSDVRATMLELKKNMPDGVDYTIVYDPTIFVQKSIDSVIITLLQAVSLVVLVVILFLQTWRASIIPLSAVPVSIVGTFAVMLVLGFSINVLSLFGLILAIGIVVDDAIVVTENVERNIEEGKKPFEAAQIAMKEVTGPVIATSLVLAGVFIPISFMSGLTGQFYQQFALTIVIATFISTINSLTLSPALAAILLKPKDAPRDPLMKLMDFAFGLVFKVFNAVFNRLQIIYGQHVCRFVTRRTLITSVIYLILVVATFFSFRLLAPNFVPIQDKQYLISIAQLPSGATLERTEEVVLAMSEIIMDQPGVTGAVQFPGLSINGFTNAPNSAIVFVTLDEFENRRSPELSADAIVGALMGKMQAISEAQILVLNPPPVRGLGNSGGFKLQIQDRSDQGYEALANIVNAVQGQTFGHPAIAFAFSNYDINVPQLFADIDRTKAQQLGIPIDEIFSTMQIYLGSQYINDFNQFGRTYQVIAQADKPFRATPEDINSLKVRNESGDMIPLGSFTTVEETFGPQTAMRYNAFRSADLTGAAAPGFSTGEAQAAIEEILANTLPQGMGYEWTELTYQQKAAEIYIFGVIPIQIMVFGICLLMVFLILAAQYESLTMPVPVILIVPMAVLSSIVGIYFFGGDNNIFTQIALFVLAGLACKNAILIVEFARELENQGRSITQAAVESARMRLRPIMMTSISFIAGVLPLVFSSGAGSEMREAIGIAVFSGMVGVTFFGLVFTPMFYVVLRKWEVGKKGREEDEPCELSENHNSPL